MNNKVQKIFIWIASIIDDGVFAYLGFVASLVFSFTSDCGMDNGPFNAIRTSPIELTEKSKRFKLSKGGELILTNRNDTLSPILTLIENGKNKLTLAVDVRNTKGYESCILWKISNITVTMDTDPIKLSFIGHWTYGAEAGSMEVDRKKGVNSFCLSW